MNDQAMIEKKANLFRRQIGIDSMGISNIFDVCSEHFNLIRYPIGEKSVCGASLIKNNDIIVFSNSSCILSKEIFTVAHEIGHIVLEHINQNNQSHHDLDISESTGYEEEANYFAVCLLMPREKVFEFILTRFGSERKSEWTPLDIATAMTVFNVSYEVVVKRLLGLNYISIQEKNTLMAQKSKTKVSSLLIAAGGSADLCYAQKQKRLPSNFIRWIEYNYRKGVISRDCLEKAVSYMDNVQVEDFSIDVEEQNDDFDLSSFLEDDS